MVQALPQAGEALPRTSPVAIVSAFYYSEIPVCARGQREAHFQLRLIVFNLFSLFFSFLMKEVNITNLWDLQLGVQPALRIHGLEVLCLIILHLYY